MEHSYSNQNRCLHAQRIRCQGTKPLRVSQPSGTSSNKVTRSHRPPRFCNMFPTSATSRFQDLAYEWGYFDWMFKTSEQEPSVGFRAKFVRVLRGPSDGCGNSLESSGLLNSSEHC